MLPQSPSKSKWLQPPNAGSPAVWRAGTRGEHYLCLLACLWLLGALDLGLSAAAQGHGLLDGGSERNPLAALVLPFGPGALVVYKALLTAGGTAGLLLCRRHLLARWAAMCAVIIYALVALNWVVFYGIFAPLRASSPRLGAFCFKADCIAVLTLTCLVVLCGLATCLLRKSQGRFCRGLRSEKSSRSEQGAVPHGHWSPPVGLCGLTAMMMWICLVPLSCSPTHSAPEQRAARPEGTIYFRECLDKDGTWPEEEGPLWRMNADGSGKIRLPRGVRGEPSRNLHGGCRWFLNVGDVPGPNYPDGGRRRELFAIRSDGYSVQLTDQPDLEPSRSVARWPAHAEGQAVSWIARRWDHKGQVVEGGIYIADLAHRGDGCIEGLAGPPSLVVPFPLVEVAGDADPWWRSGGPAIRSHDWSSDGTAIVYDSTKSELVVAALPGGRTTCITALPACSPVWSPDGTRIAFTIGKLSGGIATIGADGSDLKTVTVLPSGELLSVTTPTWSPTGGHLAYQQLDFRKPVEHPADFDVFVAAADGHAPVNLTPDLDVFLVPVAWR